MSQSHPVHPLVEQLRFARSEFKRGLHGVTDEESMKRFMPMNCLSWNIGHLAWQEQRYWLIRAQGRTLMPSVNHLFAYGAPACKLPMAEAWEAWNTITAACDPWLNAVTTALLDSEVVVEGKALGTNWGSLLLRTIDHYWYHNGENQAIRQLLGHTDLGVFVGDIDHEARYRPE